jgi:hypothetical protein
MKIYCPRCGGSVFRSYEDRFCINCGWYDPNTNYEPIYTIRRIIGLRRNQKSIRVPVVNR